MSRAARTADTGRARGIRPLLVVLCGVQFLDAIDIAAMGPALPRIQHELGMSPALLQWVVSAYVLGYGGFLLLGGRLADLFDRKRLLIGWLLFFVLASVVGGLAGSGTVLIGARLAKGVAAGFTAPAALAILLHSYPEEEERNRALGTYVAIAAVGFVLGLVLGGVLTDLTWRLTMFFPAAVGIVVAAGAAVIVPGGDGSATGERPAVDALGAVTITIGLLALVYAASNAATADANDAVTIAALVMAIGLIGVFVLVERGARAPLVPLQIFTRPGLARANFVMALIEGDFIGWQFVMTLYLQNELHWSPLAVGVAFIPGPAMMILTAQRWARLVGRVGPWPLAAGGVLLQGAGFLWSSLMLGHVPGWAVTAVPILVMGLGFAAAYPAMNIAAVGGARQDEQGLASGLFIASFQIGSGVILGIVASIFAVSVAAGLGTGAYRAGALTAFGAAALALLVCLAGAIRQRRVTAASVEPGRP